MIEDEEIEYTLNTLEEQPDEQIGTIEEQPEEQISTISEDIYTIGVESLNGQAGHLTLKNINGTDLVGAGDITLATPSDVQAEATAREEADTQLQNAINTKQDTLTAGDNIQINGTTISATDTTYSAGEGLNLNNTTFSVDTTTIATQGDVSNLQEQINGKQDQLSQTQLDAVNSGIDSTKVEQIATNATNITNLQNTKQDNLTQTQLNAVNSGIDATKVSQIATNTGNITSNTNRITTIEGKIPSTATSSNQLTDKSYVDNAIATNTANYISDNGQPFQSLADLEAYSGPLTNNDYAFVETIDQAGNDIYTRYKYNASQDQWAEEYTITSPYFTSDQWASINSGIAANDVTQIGTNKTDIAGLQTSKQDKLTTAQQAAVDSGIDATKVQQIATNASNITALQTGKQDKLTAGTNIQINGTTISATDTTYTAGTGLTLTGTQFSVTDPTPSGYWTDEATTTGTGSVITLNNTLDAKLADIKGYGDTAQVTYSGKNLWSLLPSYTNDTSGARWVLSDTAVSFPAGTYTFSSNVSTVSSANKVNFKYANNADNITIISEGTATVTFTEEVKKAAIYLSGEATISNIQLEAGQTATTYEPYVGGTPSPNPDYPQNVNVVTGEQTVSVTGKNLFDADYFKTATYTTGIYNYTTTDFGHGNTYALSCSLKPGKTAMSGVHVYISNATNPNSANRRKSFVSDGVATASETVTFPKGETVYFQYYPTSTDIAQVFETYNMQLELGSTATAFEPYQGQTYPLSLTGKNKFDPELLPASWSNTTPVYKVLRLAPNTTYTISSNIPRNNGNALIFFLTTTDTISTNRNGVWEGQSRTLTTDATGNNIQLVYRSISGESYTRSDYTFQLEVGSSATTYEAFSSTELAKIGTYQDYIYKSNDKWYKHTEVGKVVLNGSENITHHSTFNNILGVRLPVSPNALHDTTVLSDYFHNVSFYDYYNNGNTKRTYGTICTHTDQDLGNIYASAPNSSVTTAEQFKTWLSTHNTTAYYVLATPTETEITDTTLIAQLNALASAQSVEGRTIITVTSVSPNLPLILEAKVYQDTHAGLEGAIATKQDELTAGTNIDIDSNVVSTQTRGVEYIVGTQTATTNVWTGVSTDRGCSNGTLYVGKTIVYYLPQAGNSSAATLTLTLPDGTTTSAIGLRRAGSSTVTTHYAAGNAIFMTYDGTYWKTSAYYDSNSNTVSQLRAQNAIKAVTAITADTLCCGSSAGYIQLGAGSTFDITYPLLWQTGATNAGATSTSFYYAIESRTVRNNKSGWTGTANQMVWLVGTLSGNTFTVGTDVFTQTIPTTEDGKVYAPIGIAYSAYQIYFKSPEQFWWFKSGEFRPVAQSEVAPAGFWSAPATITSTGTNLNLNNQLPVAIKNVQIDGNTEQISYTGKNLFSGKWSQFDNTGGTGSTYAYFKLPSEQSYYMTLKAKNAIDPIGRYIGFSYNGGDAGTAYRWIYQNNTATAGQEFKGNNTGTSSIRCDFVFMYPNNSAALEWLTENFEIQLEQGSAGTAYEPYVGGIPSPNPDYPQAVNTVTGKQTVGVMGKNLCTNITISGTTIILYHFNKNSVKSGNYSLSTILSEDVSARNVALVINGDGIRNLTTITGTAGTTISCSFELTEDDIKLIKQGTDCAIRIYKSGANFSLPTVGQIEKGSTATAYEPYQSQSYTVNLGQNLFNTNRTLGVPSDTAQPNTTKRLFNFGEYVEGITMNNYYSPALITSQSVSDNTISIQAASSGYGLGFPIRTSPSTSYAVSFTTNSTANDIIRASFYEADGTIISWDTSANTSTEYKFTTPANCAFTLIVFRPRVDELTTFSNIMLVEGSTVAPYVEYFTPIELCKIGTYQDYIYKDGADWKIHKAVGKVVLDGTEADWVKGSTGTAQNVYIVEQADALEPMPASTTKCDYFTYNNAVYDLGQIGFYFSKKANNVQAIRFGLGTSSDFDTLSEWTTWLSTHNTTVYYALATATDTQITDADLIAQLEALASAQMKARQTNIVSSGTPPNLDAILTIETFQNNWNGLSSYILEANS